MKIENHVRYKKHSQPFTNIPSSNHNDKEKKDTSLLVNI